MIAIGNQCQCKVGFERQVSGRDFICIAEDTVCGTGAVIKSNNRCECSNGSWYDESQKHSNPCGGGSSNRTGLTIADLENACRGVGQWSNGFCACTSPGQQFNAVSRRCEPIAYHHTSAMCGAGAKFYGQGGRGVCICANGSHFNPTFGGCTTPSVTTSQAICATMYGGNWDTNRSSCDCNNSGVWFRGACLNLGNDFFTSVQGLPPEVQCEVKGGRIINGKCQMHGAGGVGGPGTYYGYKKVITCDREDRRLNVKERVWIYPDRIEVDDYIPFSHSPTRYRYKNRKDYFKDRCINKSVSASGMWLRGFGTYSPNVGSPTFGSCRCAYGFITMRHPQLGYEYCAEAGGYNEDPICHWDWERDTHISASWSPAGGWNFSGCVARNHKETCFSHGKRGRGR